MDLPDAQTVVRILCGAFLLPHTISKLSNIERASQFFANVGLRPPRAWVLFTSAMEVTAAFGLISGLYPRLAALIIACVLVCAAIAIAKLHGLKWRWQHPGIEYMLFWAVVSLCVGFLP